MISPDSVLIKIERSALERFKNENSLLKEFGNDGIKVYRALKEGSSASAVISETGLDEDTVFPILEFMEENGMLTAEGGDSEGETDYQDDNGNDEQLQEDESVEDESADKDYSSDGSLTDSEKKIKAKFGDMGLRVYSLIDGIRTANEIMEEADVSEAQLMEVLNFLEKEGIITLDQQDQRGKDSETKEDYGVEPEHPEALKDKLKGKEVPLDEIDTDKEDEIVDLEGDIIPIDLPFKATKSSIQAYPALTKLMMSNGKKIMDLYNSIDGFKDVVALALEHRMTLPNLNSMFAELGKSGLILFRPLNRKEIKSRYGDDGYAVYKMYGVEGVFLYELVGKIDDLKTMVSISGIEPRRVVDIFIFIHKVLGIDIPISKKLLYKQLGLD